MKKIDVLRKSFKNVQVSLVEMIEKKSKKLGYVAIYAEDFETNTGITVDGEWAIIEAIKYVKDEELVKIYTTQGLVELEELYVGDLFTIYDLLDEYENK